MRMSTPRVSAAAAFAAAWLIAVAASAQQAPAPRSGPEPFSISDNSFLVEEAFNQEAGIFQNIFTMTRSAGGRLDGSFTQEWPVGGQASQFSYTIPFAALDGRRGLGDVLINYRFQALSETRQSPAFSPRVSLVVPSGRQEDGFGSGVVGWQVNLPFSKQVGDVYLHWNAGLTHLPGVRAPGASSGAGVGLVSPAVSASAIYRLRKMLNVMCEVVLSSTESLETGTSTARQTAFTVSPGFRGGWNVGERQVIVGLAAPITVQDGASFVGALTYFSYELPWRD